MQYRRWEDPLLGEAPHRYSGGTEWNLFPQTTHPHRGWKGVFVEDGTRHSVVDSDWGVAWFLWNGLISVAVISLVVLLNALAEQIASGGGIDFGRLTFAYLVVVPIYSFFGWMVSSALIAAVWATGIRKQILARVPIAVLPVLLVAASENVWMMTGFIGIGVGMAASLRLPKPAGTRRAAGTEPLPS